MAEWMTDGCCAGSAMEAMKLPSFGLLYLTCICAYMGGMLVVGFGFGT